ncbi:MAG: 4Fe-4S dicluster domain-containing protein [Alphaproteobacteria bacterium]|nr:MAG: 4Fe-4S dicluster domain-containing protein [Alphaproteobacteria bacterium]
MVRTLVTCDCLGSQEIDADGLARATGLEVPAPCTALCTRQIDRAAAAIESGEAVICCRQEARVFEELAADLDRPAPPLLDLRDRAGWTDDTAPTLPKMAALAAEALLPAHPAKSLDVVSEGLCLILGPAEAALAAAEALKDHLGVTVLLDSPPADLPATRDFDIVTGRLRGAKGALGGFEVAIDALSGVEPGGRGGLRFTPPRDGAVSQCDIILDLSGDTPLFPAPEKREGYLRADPRHPPAVAAAVLEASHLTGTFEKPLYVITQPALCAHSRAGQTGCTRCLDLCPTGAIAPDGDTVAIDPMICAGCGACSAACPSGAVSYDAPAVELVMRRIQTLASAFRDAAGDAQAPRLLVHDAHGAEMIRLAARFGRGLPADVVPFELPAIGAFGHAEALAALAAGFAAIALLPGPGADRDAMAAQLDLARAMAGERADALRIIEPADPDALSEALFGETPPAALATPVAPLGARRQIARAAARALNPEGAVLPLPEGAPYGTVVIDKSACTLCLSCISLCPSGALGDNPDLPQIRFQEDACLQCGICATVCPENAIGYVPRLDLSDAALDQRVLHEEEPFACIECGKPFGVKSTIDRMTARLADHPAFAGGERIRMIQMCDDCKVRSQFHSEDNPFAIGERPRVRTTEDYLARRRDD